MKNSDEYVYIFIKEKNKTNPGWDLKTLPSECQTRKSSTGILLSRFCFCLFAKSRVSFELKGRDAFGHSRVYETHTSPPSLSLFPSQSCAPATCCIMHRSARWMRIGASSAVSIIWQNAENRKMPFYRGNLVSIAARRVARCTHVNDRSLRRARR